VEEKYTCPKMTPKQWIANVWYYHKWMIIFGVIVIAFISICVAQYASKSEADAGILIVSGSHLSDSACESIVSSSEKIVKDLNGDGEVSVLINSITLYSDLRQLDQLERDQAQEDYRQYSNEILSGELCILILDEYFYRELAENGNLVNLYGVFDEMPKAAFDYYGLSLGETPLYQMDGFSKLSPDMVLCLKHTPVVSGMSEEQRTELDINNVETFRSFYLGEADQ